MESDQRIRADRDGTSRGPVPDRSNHSERRAHVVLFEAAGCVECRRMAPIVEAVAADHAWVALERVDARESPESARGLGVWATPTLIGYAGQTEIGRIVGRRSRAEVARLFEAAGAGGSQVGVPARSESVLRLVAAAVVGAIGLAAGPSWLLLSVAFAIGVYGLRGLIRGRRR